MVVSSSKNALSSSLVWFPEIVWKRSPKHDSTIRSPSLLEIEYHNTNLSLHEGVNFVVDSPSNPLEVQSTPICPKKQLFTPPAPSKTRTRPQLRPLTLVSGLISKTSHSSDRCQPPRSRGSFSSRMSVIFSSKKEGSNSSGSLETSDNDTSRLASTPATSLSSHASLPVDRQSLGYLQKGKPIVSPSNRSSVSNVVKKVEVAKEKEREKRQLDEPLEKEKGVVAVIHRPEKIWHRRSVISIREEAKFERLLKEVSILS
ncbi:hypothetical protein BDQ12DRAFT_49348 [Crucibulum laeve]|uniref:Uncharacterized protein n=1 Tax=Crucibulum laeve TaxID=68775 RepID=A0A5C3MJP6_9AGAR|nr:hypothetical protein BDQ12DRAFT_49348 [Crucibulum laeve]